MMDSKAPRYDSNSGRSPYRLAVCLSNEPAAPLPRLSPVFRSFMRSTRPFSNSAVLLAALFAYGCSCVSRSAATRPINPGRPDPRATSRLVLGGALVTTPASFFSPLPPCATPPPGLGADPGGRVPSKWRSGRVMGQGKLWLMSFGA